ncbi:MAG: LPS export ABC transporter ATP-binding protein [Candidatus Jidaibacter sp.]|jgi:lipopolysaccharide export system ATP-binding protein|nr:LPS export ABC transporter ATP-binding protein [Candidatus Jidaibacter sp.]
MKSKSVSLRVESIGKSFKGRRVVRDVSFAVHAGQIVGILGPNGAGKTTSFYMVTGLILPDTGRILLDDIDITSLPMYQRARLGIGYLPQESSIFRGLTVEENILAILELHIKDEEQRMHRLDELLAEFSITHLRHASAIALSGGERRRVEIARAIAMDPSFLLLDEPLAGIDPIAVHEIKELILQLKNLGIGIIITDHNVRDALSIIEKAYIFHDGSVMLEGTPEEVIGNQKVKEIYLGDSFTEAK